MKITDKISLYHTDCMDFMRDVPDNYYELCICDPPYGIGDKFKGGNSGKMQFNEVVDKGWDCVPEKEYFDELFRVSKNQIIWGGNYFDLPPTRCFIVWDKQISDDFTLAMAELAWTSFDKLAKIYKLSVPKNGKIHPTQKPVALYKWLLDKYAKPNDKILDTHGGSMSIAIACHDYGFDLDLCEMDKEYFDKGVQRVKNHVAQTKLF
jgi:site-specific DNA-methyltransferase (adenine-specific)